MLAAFVIVSLAMAIGVALIGAWMGWSGAILGAAMLRAFVGADRPIARKLAAGTAVVAALIVLVVLGAVRLADAAVAMAWR